MIKAIPIALAAITLAAPLTAQTPQTYSDGKRGEVTLPQGDLSFADRVVTSDTNDSRIKASAQSPEPALGPPNYSGRTSDGSFATLGCGGALTLQFTDNVLVDLSGPDLYVFEVGPDVEAMELAISVDGLDWIDVGGIEGGRSEVDIAGAAQAGVSYRFVRLTDDGADCSGNFPGADVDAVAAIGSAQVFVLDGTVLFDTGSAALAPPALQALDELATEIAAAGITAFEVVGHTDAVGDDAANLTLSADRASAVRDYLTTETVLRDATVTTRGAGESEPVASNDTDDGRAANRRVEIIAKSGD